MAVVIPTLATVAVAPLADPAVEAVANWAGPWPSAADWLMTLVATDALPLPHLARQSPSSLILALIS
jgi:hypothetical protein